jgi:predicted metal-dependent phosphotriesterase family hydrolase
MAEMMIAELTDGVGKSGIKAGIIKVATSAGVITDYEKTAVLRRRQASNDRRADHDSHRPRHYGSGPASS